MFKEILKIIPQLSTTDLNKMDQQLRRRFMNLAKSFGKGLKNVLMGGGVAGIALALVDKILNPLKETQEAIDRVLKQGDDLVTNAKQFGTTAGRLAKLQALGQATGLDADNLNLLLAKFQTTLAEAQADPTKQTSVRNFVGSKDTAEAFFQFIQQMQKMTKEQQVLVQQEVFGEKQILKMADFLQSDFGELSKSFAKFDTDKLDQAANKLGGLSDLNDTLGAQRNLQDLISKGGVVNQGMIQSFDKNQKIEQQKETDRIKSYQAQALISEGVTKIGALLEKGLFTLTELLTNLKGVKETVDKIPGSRFFKGLFGGGDK